MSTCGVTGKQCRMCGLDLHSVLRTQCCFDVYTTPITLYRRRMDNKMKFRCVRTAKVSFKHCFKSLKQLVLQFFFF